MWDCKYKINQDGCRRRKVDCFPGGKLCILEGKFEYPLRDRCDQLGDLKSCRKSRHVGKIFNKGMESGI